MAVGVCARVNAQGDPATVGQWSAVFNTNFEPVHTMVLPTGKVLFWSIQSESLNPQIWDPATGNVAPTPLPGYQLFCAGHSFLGNGQLLVTGGNLGDFVGVAYASLYDPISNTWTRVPDMNAGRWYPTNTTLANGDVLVVSGEINNSTGVDTLAQVWQAATQSWRDLTSAQLALALYPRMFLAPNGKVFYATPNSPSRYLDTSGTGSWTAVANLNFDSRDYDTAVMYAPGKILTVGGADPPTATAEVIDLNASSPSWRFVGSMATARRQLNGTILADGKVLITGGSSGSGFDNASAPVFLTEMWDPATEQFTPMASITKYRGYHSNAVLLPDGRVLSAGGDVSGATAEIFSPPYLFKGPRPAISSGPAKIRYGQPFTIGTPDAAGITQVNLIRLSSDTHSFNQDQRINSLSFTAGSGSLTIQAPSDGRLVPPGPYMVFVLNGSGVPSVAQIVQMTADLPPTAKAAATPASGPVPLNVSFSSAGSVDPDGSIASYAWDFGDGQNSAAANTTHVYSSPGTYTATLTVTDNQGTTGQQTLFVTATGASPPPPTLLSVSPARGTQGAKLKVVLAGSNFQSGAACNFGAGISVISCAFNSPSQLTANLVLGSAAPAGAHDVTVVNPDSQTGALTGAFLVDQPPSVTAVTPNGGAQAQTATVVITGNNFQSGSACSFGSGTSVTSCVFNSPTQATATVSIRPTASLGPRDVTVTDPDSQSGTLIGGFSITPMVGGTLHEDFNYPNRTSLLAAGWDFNAMTATGAIRNTELSANLAVDYNQTVHPGTLRVPILEGNIYQATNTSQNSLLQDLPADWISIRLMIASFAPVANYQQVNLMAYQDDDNYVALTRQMDGNPPAADMEFFGEQGAVAMPGGSIQALSNTGNLLLRLDRNAPANTYTAFYSTNAGASWTAMGSLIQVLNNPRLAIVTGANAAGTSLTADLAWVEIIRPGTAAPPTISFISPGSGVQGQSANVVMTGSNFQSGAQCSFGIGIAVTSCAFNSASQLTAALAINANAPLGMHDVTITNPDGQSGTLGGGFFVNSGGPQPVITSVSPASGNQGQSLSSVVLRGSNFASGAQCDFGAGITVSACLLSSATQLSASLTIAPGAAVGPRDVTVTNPNNQSVTLTAGFSVTQGTVGLAPATLSFDNQAIGTTSPSAAVVLTNQTSLPLSITAFNISGDFAQTNNCGTSLVAGAACTISISFRPAAQGPRSGSLIVSDTGPNSPQAVSLSGMGTATPSVAISPANVDFGSVLTGQASAPQTIALQVSGAPLTIQSVDLTSPGFTQQNRCSSDVAAGSQCSIIVFFQPSAPGTFTAAMRIQDDAANSPQTIQFKGVGSHYTLAAAGGAGQIIAPGQTANFTVNLDSLSGLTETASVSCSGAPPLSTCSLSQSSFPLTGSRQTLAVTVATNVHSSSPVGFIHGRPSVVPALCVGSCFAIWLLVSCFGGKSRPSWLPLRFAHMLSVAALIGLAVAMVSCGGGTSSGGGGGSPSQNLTPAGPYVVTITGTSSNPANPPQVVQLPFTVN
jgi:PKD repeat protein